MHGVTDPTQIVGATPVEGGDAWAADDPAWAATGTVPAMPAPAPTAPFAEPPATQRSLDTVPSTGGDGDDADASGITDDDVWAPTSETYRAVEPAAAAPDLPASHTTEMPIVVAQAPRLDTQVGTRRRFRFSTLVLCGFAGAVVALASSFTTAVKITSDTRLIPTAEAPPAFRTGTWMLDDLADNMSIAVLIAAMLMVVGGVASGFGSRAGSGIAGGAGLAMAGLASVAIGLSEMPLETARQFAAVPNPQEFTLTLKHDVGFVLFVAAAALGVLVFFASINHAFGERRRGLNPWIAALGAVGTVAAVAGPTFPKGAAIFSDNWYLFPEPGSPTELLVAGRLVQLGLIAITGIVGYLCVRRWGLGLAIGGALPAVWLAVSSLFELTDNPIGPGYRNPGAVDSDLHGVTIIGFSAVVAIAILAIIAAYDQTSRERR